MKSWFGPVRLGLIGAVLFVGCLGWFYVWSHGNEVSPALSDGPTAPIALRLAALLALGLILYAVIWGISRILGGRSSGERSGIQFTLTAFHRPR